MDFRYGWLIKAYAFPPMPYDDPGINVTYRIAPIQVDRTLAPSVRGERAGIAIEALLLTSG